MVDEVTSAKPPGAHAQAGRAGGAGGQPILEVNAEHALVKRLESTRAFDDLAQILFDQAMLAEGGTLEDPAAYK